MRPNKPQNSALIGAGPLVWQAQQLGPQVLKDTGKKFVRDAAA
jgi:hypothetical protein